MRTRVLMFVVAVVCGTGVAAAQTTADPMDVAAGVKGGVNSASISESFSTPGSGKTVSYDSKIGLILGGFVRKPLTESFSIQPELLLSRQGSSFEDDSVTLTYLQVPILGVATFSGESARPYLFAGPALSLKVMAKSTVGSVTRDLEDVAGTDFSAVFGGGVEMGQALVEVRYSLGLKNVNTLNGVTDKNRVFSFLVGYRIR